MRTLRYFGLIALATFAVSVPEVRAQGQEQQPAPGDPQQTQGQSSQPIQAYHPPLGGAGASGGTEDANGGAETLVPDNSSLAGAEYLSLGAPKTGYHFWTPYFDLSSTLDSNPGTSTGGGGWSTWTTIYGGLDLHRTSGNSDVALSYLGGEAISNNTGIGDSTVQQLGLSDRITFRRSAVMFADQLAYLPEASFGYAGVGGPDLGLGGNVGLQGGFTPNQSILTGLGDRVSNSFVTQFDRFLTPRSTLTLVGSYGVLDYFGSDLNNNREAIFQGGYSYLMTRKDTIAFLYRFDALRYDHIAQSINSHAVEVSYGRRVTGRLALQVTGGPDVAFSETPITGSSTSPVLIGTPSGKTRQFFWNLSLSANYSLRRTSLELSYDHGVTGGSGVLAGALTDNVLGRASRQLTRTMNGAWNIGYSRNKGDAITLISPSIYSGQTYDYWFTGVSVTRKLGRAMNLFLSYQVNYQNSNSSFCVTATCGNTYLQNQISLTLGWHPGPRGF
jgi:hypothetical protein